MALKISVIILTYNSERTIANTLKAVHPLSDDIHVVDSFSGDDTCAIVRAFGVNLVQHPFINYSAQRNWASSNLPLKHEWELHLDADERLSEQLASELFVLKGIHPPAHINGYCMPRLIHFLGRPITHGGMFPIWHMRLLRRGYGHCEEREYDQHFIVEGATAKLYGCFIDDIRMPLTEWTARHNRWSDIEVRELSSQARASGLRSSLTGNPLERKRYFRKLYERLPPFGRSFALFAYRYLLRGGFLDGKEGLVFFCLQTFWFRFLIDAKLFEQRLSAKEVARMATVATVSIGASHCEADSE